jgi:hypothetical protein
MPHETRTAPSTGDPESGATALLSLATRLSGDYEFHADPQLLVTATIEIFLTLRKRLTQLLTIPVGAQGGFLQPPSSSPSSEA